MKCFSLLSVVALSLTTLASEQLNLNGVWDFRFEQGKSWKEMDIHSPMTDKMVVPGCFDAIPKWYMKRGTGLYQKTFTIDQDKKQAWLVIDGMGLFSKYWIDGKEVGIHDLPYSKVELPVGALKAGDHTITAVVDNRFDWNYNKLVRPYYDFHFWGGFYHGVSLSFDNRKFFIRTKDYQTGTIQLEAVHFADADFEAELTFDGKNKVKASFKKGRATLAVPEAKLWSPEEPNLHTVAFDGVQARFGIRTIEARNGGLYLNGKRIFLKGANRHDQYYHLGAATPESIMLTDIQNLKAMNGNFFRGAHYPQSQRFLELCDEMGVLVWEESLGWGNGQSYTYPRTDGKNEFLDPLFCAKQIEQTRLMVRNSFNHPSVIIFAFLNEPNSKTKEAKSLVDKLIDTIHNEDSGRLVTFACNIIKGDICHEKTDIIAFNTYPGTINGYPGEHDELVEKIHNMDGHGIDWVVNYLQNRYPGKTIMISEMGVGGMYGQRDTANSFNTEDFQDEHNRIIAEAVWNNPGVAGIAYWQFFDTRTCGRECAGDSRKPQAMSRAGLFDRYRRPKLGVKTLTEWFSKTPANLK